jgi:hypothetical protein
MNATGQSRISTEAKATPAALALTGTLIGTAGSWGNNPATTAAAAFDGNLSTYFDGPTANGDWVGLDLGTSTTISDIRYAPRTGYESRMVGGVFQASNSVAFTNPVTLFTVTATPTSGTYATVIVTDPTAYRYVRYLGAAGSYGDVAEVEFDHAIAPPTVAIAPAASPSPVNGAQANLSVLGADYFGEPNLIYKWSAVGTPPASVTFSVNDSNAAKNTTVSFAQPGTYNFLVSITDPAGLWTTTGLTVVVNPSFATQTGSTLNLSLSPTEPVTLGSSGANVTATQNGTQLNFSGITSIVVTDTGTDDTVNFSGPLNIPISFSGASTAIVNVSAGTMMLAAVPGGAINIGTLSISDGASVILSSSTTSQPTTLNLTSLALDGSGQFDITNNVVYINYGTSADPIASIANELQVGFHGGAWNGFGIVSTNAAANAGTCGIGYADSADAGNPANLAAGTIKIMYTLLGDCDLNGVVNGIDFGIVAANFNHGVSRWDQGDFDYNNIVNGIDFGYVAANFNQGLNISAAVAVVATNGSATSATSAAKAVAPKPATHTVSRKSRHQHKG